MSEDQGGHITADAAGRHTQARPEVLHLSLMIERRLWPLWGSAPHRISHTTAMAMAPAAVKTGGFLDVSGMAVCPETASHLLVRPYEESTDTLLLGARQLHGPTWVSSPERALLECLRSVDNVSDGDSAAAQVLYTGHTVSPRRVVELAERLGWERPLRRLASLARRMNNCRGVFKPAPEGFLPASQQLLLNISPAPADAGWICLMPYRHEWVRGDPSFRDEEYRVVWWDHPHEFLEDLLY